MKGFFRILMVLSLFVVPFTACNDDDDDNNKKTENNNESPNKNENNNGGGNSGGGNQGNEEGDGNDNEEIVIDENGNGTRNGHVFVSLDLPSGNLWATTNVGASKPEEYGDYFAWGEVETKSAYLETNSKWYGMLNSDLQAKGEIDATQSATEKEGIGNLAKGNDAASCAWKHSWKMPTIDDYNELLKECKYEWSERNGVKGMLFTGKNGNTLFFPAAGFKKEDSLSGTEQYGLYWTSNAFRVDWYAGYFNFVGTTIKCNKESRHIGMPVRAMLKTR